MTAAKSDTGALVDGAPEPASERTGTRRVVLLRVGLATVVTTAFALLLIRNFSIGRILTALDHVGRGRLLAGAMVVCVTILLRGLRLCLCLGERPAPEMMSVAVVHSALVATLPAKLGELALPALLARARGTAPLRGVGILVLLRVFDLFAMGTVGASAAALVYFTRNRLIGLGFASAALACVTGLLLLGRHPGLIRRWIVREDHVDGRIRRWIAEIASGISELEPRTGKRLAILSVAIWMSLFTSFFVLSGAFSGGITWCITAVEGMAGSLAFALPVNGIANVGPFQAAWVAAGATLGIPMQVSLMGALLSHGEILATTALLGLVGGCIIVFRRSPWR